MTDNPNADGELSFASLPNDPQQLRREADALIADKAELELKIRELRNSEDPELGFFLHEEIFTAQQDKLRLLVEIDMRERKIKRLAYGLES